MDAERQIQFNYVFPENYNPLYCNGAFGGVSTRGEIIANFFFERMTIPKSMTHLVNPDGTLSGIVSVDPEDVDNNIVRYVTTGIVLSEESAESIYAWLGTQLQDLKLRKSMKGVDIE